MGSCHTASLVSFDKERAEPEPQPPRSFPVCISIFCSFQPLPALLSLLYRLIFLFFSSFILWFCFQASLGPASGKSHLSRLDSSYIDICSALTWPRLSESILPSFRSIIRMQNPRVPSVYGSRRCAMPQNINALYESPSKSGV